MLAIFSQEASLSNSLGVWLGEALFALLHQTSLLGQRTSRVSNPIRERKKDTKTLKCTITKQVSSCMTYNKNARPSCSEGKS